MLSLCGLNGCVLLDCSWYFVTLLPRKTSTVRRVAIEILVNLVRQKKTTYNLPLVYVCPKKWYALELAIHDMSQSSAIQYSYKMREVWRL